MSIDHIERELKSSKAFAARKGSELLEEAIDLYVQKRIEGTNIERDGDMLLFQWGTYDWGRGRNFEVDLTRQIMLDLPDSDEAADSMRQLHVKLIYPCSTETEKIGNGNRWCGSPSVVSEFVAYVQESEAFLFAANVPPASVTVSLEYV